ncbi:outer membrane usher protein [Serratia fonticola]|uniref:Outer membrane usher protein n=1 Tax=Serratia fonticola TaxID=47917 RepID=A0A542D576_SERFO|nr:fimbria/pilus outer membrane usher protein [Serratia fonticola]TQI79743.1 outer membrane usher protein [Serratia fonticola]TQI98231.1 outer membrane usher protein [Serratia fonticola]TVZ67759.1 outer membrane usher protein [Serratia fonticola]
MNNNAFISFMLLIFPCFVNAGEYFYVSQDERDIGYIELDMAQDGFPCFDRRKLLEWQIISQENINEVKESGCIKVKDLYPLNITVTLIEKVNLLIFTLLQSSEVKNDARLAIANRDEGIPAILLNYDVNYKKYEGARYTRRKRKDNLIVELESGINYQQWRLRSKQYHDNEDMRQERITFADLYIERDISAINSRLHIGEGYNNTFYLSSFPYRGIKLASDDNMFPSSQGAVLPWVYGVAISDAEVEIRQSGKPVYRTMVPAGDFVLRNIKLFDKSGYISMTVKESDGSINYYDVPWNRLDNILDKAMWKYDVSFGKFMSNERTEESNPVFFQAGAGYGLSTQSSLFGGALLSPGYYSHSIGIGQRLNQYGDITVDHQYSSIVSAEQKKINGEKLRLQYVTNFSKANTSVRMNGEYYLQPHFNDFNSYSYNSKSNYYCCDYYKKEYGFDLSINSMMSASQNLTFNINQEKYQAPYGKRTFYSLKLMQYMSNLSFDLDMSYYQYATQKNEMRFGITFRIPLKKLGVDNTSLNVGYSYNPYDFYQTELGVSGRHLNNNLNYQVMARNGKQSRASYQANANYRYAAGESGIRYSSGTDYALYSVRSAGSLVAHQAGITLGPTLGETNALVYSQKHPNATLPDQIDVVTDNRGYAIIPDLIPYQLNVVNDAIGQELEFGEPIDEVVKVPTLGALSYYELIN